MQETLTDDQRAAKNGRFSLGAFGVGGALAIIITIVHFREASPGAYDSVDEWLTGPGVPIGAVAALLAMVSAILASWAPSGDHGMDRWSKLFATTAATLAFWGVALAFWGQFHWIGFLLLGVAAILLIAVFVGLASTAFWKKKTGRGVFFALVAVVIGVLGVTWPFIIHLVSGATKTTGL